LAQAEAVPARTIMRSLALLLCVAGIELTPDSWDEATEGKTVFIKFLAPW